MKKTSRRAGVRISSKPPTGSTAPRKRVSRSTKSERRTPQPRTAYDLCELVAQHIEEEPHRYYQRWWGFADKDRILQVVGATPACGTTACRGGWIVGLHDGMTDLRNALMDGGFDVEDRANAILDMTSGETTAIFNEDALPADAGKPGTVRYARAGAAGLRKWAEQHATHLKARLLKDVPKP